MADARPGKGRVAKDSDSPMAGSNPILYLYREMLEDAASSSPASFSEEGRVVKRRRIGGRVIVSGGHDSEQSSVPAEDTDTDKGLSEKEKCKQQTAYNDSDDFTGSDMDWEQVDLGKNPVGEDMEESDREDKPMDLVLDLKGSTSPRRSIRRRKASTAEEKRMRLEVHKTHLLCLLAHVHLRNHWCNDVEVQVKLFNGGIEY